MEMSLGRITTPCALMQAVMETTIVLCTRKLVNYVRFGQTTQVYIRDSG